MSASEDPFATLAGLNAKVTTDEAVQEREPEITPTPPKAPKPAPTHVPTPTPVPQPKKSTFHHLSTYPDSDLNAFVEDYTNRPTSDGSAKRPSKSEVVLWLLKIARTQLEAQGLPPFPRSEIKK